MTNHTRQKFFVYLQGIVLCVPLSIVQINYAGWAQSSDAEVKTLDAEVNVYIRQLKDQDVTVRVAAASALGRPILGNPNFANPSGSAAVAVSALTKALRDREATVRVSAAVALGKRSYPPTTTEDVEVLAKLAVPELIKTLKDDKEVAGVRSRAANSIGEISRAINNKIKKSLPEFLRNETINNPVGSLITALNHPDVQVRASAAYALGTMGSDASIAVPTLINLLNDQKQDVIVRAKAAETLGNADLKASLNGKTVPALISALQEPKADAYFLRANAALALGSMGSEPTVAKDAVQPLIKALEDENTLVRSSAANALGLMGSKATDAVSALIKVVKVVNIKGEDAQVRTDAVNALRKIVSDRKVAPSKTNVSILTEILNNRQDKPDVRASAAYALGKMGSEVEDVVPPLIKVVEDNGENRQVRQYAAYALRDFFKEQAETNEKLLSFWDCNQLISKAEQSIKVLKNAEFSQEANQIELSLKILKSRGQLLLFQWIQQSPWVLGILGLMFCIFGFLSLWVVIFWLRPLWLLQINKSLNPIKNIELPGLLKEAPKVTVQILLYITFFNFFLYRHRVLDAWVLKHCDSVQQKFLEQGTVSNHDVYIPIFVRLKHKQISQITGISENLRQIFSQNPTYLVIQEEGGAGKTNLACQLAKWAMSKDQTERLCKHIMLPILIEREFNQEVEAGKQPFIEAISGQLRVLVGEAEPISEELLNHLLKQRRILVIVDRLSEMSEATRQKFKFGEPNFPVNALVITSRIEEEVDGKTTIQPQRIDGPQLSQFMADYLTQKGKSELAKGQEFFDACSRLLSMVGQRGSTVLLVTLYAQQVIAAKDNSTRADELPKNIPDLMRSYLNQLNSKVPKDKQRDNIEVYRDAREVAWECLKQTYQPAPAKVNDVQKALEALVEPSQVKNDKSSQEVAKENLKYLEKSLNLIKTVEHGDKINFTLNPLAEYLAALRLVDNCGNNRKKWDDFLAIVKRQNHQIEAIQGFLLAVQDCCLVKQKDANVPSFVLDKLNEWIELNVKVSSPITKS